MMRKRLAFSIALTSMLFITNSAKVEAFDYKQLIRSYVDKNFSNRNTSTQAGVKTNINNRQAQLEQEIEAGVKTGQITPAEETELRNELVKIAHLESTYLSDGKFTDPEVLKLLDEMNILSSKIKAYMSNATTTGTGNLTHDQWFKKYGSKPTSNGTIPNEALRKAHIDAMQAELDAKIQEALSNGYVSWNEARMFQVDLDQIKRDEDTFLRDGHINYDEEQRLLTSIRSLRSKVDAKSGYAYRNRSGRYGWRHRTAQKPILHQRIANGLASGKITRTEANELYKMENRVHSLENQLRSTSFSFDKQRTMFKELEQLTQAIDKKLLGM